jgi:hypothetical protein
VVSALFCCLAGDCGGDIAEVLFNVAAEAPNEGAASCGRGLVGVIGLFVFLLRSVSAPRVLGGLRVILQRLRAGGSAGGSWKFARRWRFRFAWCGFEASCWSLASPGNEICWVTTALDMLRLT